MAERDAADRDDPAALEIRPFDPDDEDAVVRLWVDCGLVVPWNDPHRDIARKLKVRPDLFLVAYGDGELVGTVMAGYDGHRGSINYVAVHPAHRHQGIGGRLMAEAEARLRAAGCPKINLLVRSTNTEVIGFYEALGFHRDDVVSLGKRLISDED
jgi:ribosomal protein S18 acetylase RimI-like enzyme